MGAGLADALGLAPGSTLALALPSGAELRLRVAGVVSSLDHDGRVAYVPARRCWPRTRRRPSRSRSGSTPRASQRGDVGARPRSAAQPAAASGATARGAPLVDVLRTILRAVAIVDGLVCLYALIQACALTVQERRRTVAVLRACGAGRAAVRRLLLGAALALVVPAAVIGVAARAVGVRPGAVAAGGELRDAAARPDARGELLATLAGLALAAAVAVAVGRAAGRRASRSSRGWRDETRSPDARR